jgi:hypothetical protein
MGQARTMIRDGYRLAKVCERTGWGGFWFEDQVGPDGYLKEERVRDVAPWSVVA